LEKNFNTDYEYTNITNPVGNLLIPKKHSKECFFVVIKIEVMIVKRQIGFSARMTRFAESWNLGKWRGAATILANSRDKVSNSRKPSF